MKEEVKEKKTLLQLVWERGEAAWDALKQSRASVALRAEAEVDLISIQTEYNAAVSDLESQILKAKESKKWKPIREAALARDLKKKELENAAELYQEFFLKDPYEFLEK